MAIAVPSNEVNSPTLKQRLARAERVNRWKAQAKGMAVALRNVSDASSLLQTADGALNELTDIMQRMKDLATQSANGTNSTADLERDDRTEFAGGAVTVKEFFASERRVLHDVVHFFAQFVVLGLHRGAVCGAVGSVGRLCGEVFHALHDVGQPAAPGHRHAHQLGH